MWRRNRPPVDGPATSAVVEQLKDVVARLERLYEHKVEPGSGAQPRPIPPTEQGC